MPPIIYDVAVSMDGFISGPDGEISRFPHHSAMVDDYFARLETYSVALMGRRTYEFGYRFGLEPGVNPYPNMRSCVFSATIQLPEASDVEVVARDALDVIRSLRNEATDPLYLCGGGELAGSLLQEGLIGLLRVKRSPILLGDGVRLFGTSKQAPELQLIDMRDYGDGLIFQEFEIT